MSRIGRAVLPRVVDNLKMLRELDIILFGATGFTGKQAIPLLSKFTKTPNRQLKWGIAGRNKQKLTDLLKESEREIGTSLNNIPVITANIEDEASLRKMARRASIIINCCGPYRFLGEAVVKACVEEGTHHVDVTGEPEYMEKMQLKYHDQAREKGIYVISACGFDSIPADLGVAFLQQNFEGTLNSVVTYMHIWIEDETIPGPSGNYATWESAVHGLANAKELAELRKKLFQKRLPTLEPKLKIQYKPHKSDIAQGWVLPFLGSDRSVIKRSQRYFYEEESKRPVQVENYMVFKSVTNIIKMETLVPIIFLLTKSEHGRKLLLKYPEIFSAGIFSQNKSPNKEKLEKTNYTLTFYGEGWKENLPGPNDQYTVNPNRAICAKISGKDPAYGSACVCLVLAAITVITERNRMPRMGGVYPPGYAFARTSLMQRLNENGLKFEILYKKDLPVSKY